LSKIEGFRFTFASLEYCFQAALDRGYQVVSCLDYATRYRSGSRPPKLLINRIDVDVSVRRAERLGELFDRLGITATFFFRLHATEYNLLSFENYRIVKSLQAAGHEIGYHSEIVDQAAIWGETAEQCLRRDLSLMTTLLGSAPSGTASHGGMTGLNNLDFWKAHKAAEFGLAYEAYDWFNEVWYVSDSEWTRWKSYNNGVLVDGDRRSLGEILTAGPAIVNSTIHPETYFDRHFYEGQ